MLNKCSFNQTKKQFFLLQLMLVVHGDKTDLNASFRYFNEAYCTFFVISISLDQFSICALLNACSVISCNWYGSNE